MKHNLIFFLTGKAITVKEISENGELRTIDVEGVERYCYDYPDEFERFFEALKVDIYNIQDFSEEEFYVTVFDMGSSGKKVPKETLERFKGYLDDCKNVAVANMDGISKVFSKTAQGEEIEGLKCQIENLKKEFDDKTCEMQSASERMKTKYEKEIARLGEFVPDRTAITASEDGFVILNNHSSNQAFKIRENVFCVKENNNFFLISQQVEETMFGVYISTTAEEKSVGVPKTGILYLLCEEGSKVKKGDVIGIVSSSANETEQTLKDWLTPQFNPKDGIRVLVEKSLGYPLIHFWGCDNPDYTDTAWPGTELASCNETDYCYDFKNASSVTILVTNQGGGKLCENDIHFTEKGIYRITNYGVETEGR